MRQPAIEDIIDVIGNRWNVLEALHGTLLTKPELESTLNVSRSTVNRAVSELEEAGLIKRSPPDGYQITAFGQPIYHLCLRMGRCLDGITEAYLLDSKLPSGELGEVVMFDGATVVQPEAHAPDRPLQELLGRIESTSSLRGCTPVVLQQYVDVCHEQVMHENLELELVVTSDVRDCLETTYTEQLAEALQQPHVYIYEMQQSLPFGIMIFDDDPTQEAGLVLYSEAGVSGIITNDNQLALGWARQMYHDHKAQAAKVEVNQLRNSV
jgi:predicted transcriptional regulator